MEKKTPFRGSEQVVGGSVEADVVYLSDRRQDHELFAYRVARYGAENARANTQARELAPVCPVITLADFSIRHAKYAAEVERQSNDELLLPEDRHPVVSKPRPISDLAPAWLDR